MSHGYWSHYSGSRSRVVCRRSHRGLVNRDTRFSDGEQSGGINGVSGSGPRRRLFVPHVVDRGTGTKSVCRVSESRVKGVDSLSRLWRFGRDVRYRLGGLQRGGEGRHGWVPKSSFLESWAGSL